MPFKKKKNFKRFKPRFRRSHKKFPLYKKIGMVWGQKTYYRKMEGRVFLNLPKLNIQAFTGTVSTRVQGDLCSMQYCLAFNMNALLFDIVPYFDSSPWSAATTHLPTNTPNPQQSGCTQTRVVSAKITDWSSNPPETQNCSNCPKLNEFLIQADNYRVMRQDFRLETDYQATKLVSASFYKSDGSFVTNNNVTVRYYFATDTNLINFNAGIGMQNGQRDNMYSNYLDTFKSSTEYSPEITNRKNKKIRMKNPAPMGMYEAGMYKMYGLSDTQSKINGATRAGGWVYMIIAVNVYYPGANITSMSLNLGQLTTTKHIVYTKSHSYKTNVGQVVEGGQWNPQQGVGENDLEIESQKSGKKVNNIDVEFEKINIHTL